MNQLRQLDKSLGSRTPDCCTHRHAMDLPQHRSYNELEVHAIKCILGLIFFHFLGYLTQTPLFNATSLKRRTPPLQQTTSELW